MSTRYYMGADEGLGLRFGGAKHVDRVRLSTFSRLERTLRVEVGLEDVARATIAAVLVAWEQTAEFLAGNPALREDIDRGLAAGAHALLATTR